MDNIMQHQQQALTNLPFCYDGAIAVVGYACRFPEAEDSHAFWQNLLAGRECSRRPSRAELLAAGLDAATIDAPNYVNVATVIKDADSFDATLFGYSASEAEALDPQQRLFLQIAWHALEHAGFAPIDVPHKTGVFASARTSTYPGQEPLSVADLGQERSLQSLLGNDKDYVATRVAYKLNLRGPALLVQTACSSSLVAVHLACESLRSGESDMAIAGGVAISFPQHSGYLHEPGMLFSPDGHCRPFDAQAQGTFAGNGVAAIVLRRLADALDDGDPVLAVLPASAMNNDGGQKAGYTVPSLAGQCEVINTALAQAGIDSTQIGLIEAHGTATSEGDLIELQALRTVFHAVDTGPPCALGSVKSNLGHLDSAAGIASMLKAIMAVEHGVIPPSLHFEQANPALQLADSPFYVPTQACSWDDATRIAGVSSFGIGGTNCHVLASSVPPALQQAIGAAGTCTGQSRMANAAPAAALLLSAASETALRQLAQAYALALKQTAPHDLAYTALHGRQLDLPYRLALSLTTVEDAAAALSGYADGDPEPMLYYGQGAPGKLVWVCTGEDTQWVGMGQSLHQQSAVFAQTLERCLDACGREYASQLRKAMFGFSAEQLAQPTLAQPVIIAFQIAMAAHWRALGLTPHMVIGQGIGEYAAAVIAEHYAIEQIMPVVCTRARLLQDWQVALPAISTLEAVDTEQWSTEQALEMTSVLSKVCASLNALPTSVRMISSVTGTVVNADQLNADAGEHWCRHLLEPDSLSTALLTARRAGATVFLELGADASLTTLAHQHMQPELADSAHKICWIASARRQQLASIQLGQALLQLYVAGIDLPWREILPSSGRKVRAPLYVFDTQRYWRDAGLKRFDGVPNESTSISLLPASTDPLLGQPLSPDGSYLVDWSDCAGLPQRWQMRLQQASEELARRHGASQRIAIDSLPSQPPEQLSLVRLRWLAEPFGLARMTLETCDDSGNWREASCAQAAAGVSNSVAMMQQDLPVALAAPASHYAWCWRHALLEPVMVATVYQLQMVSAPFSASSTAAKLSTLRTALCAAGDQRESNVQAVTQLLLIDPDASYEHIVPALLTALSSTTDALIVVTYGAWRVAEPEPSLVKVNVLHHAIWGLLRCVASEQPQRCIAAIDLAAEAAPTTLLPALTALHSGARWLAVRDGECYVPSLRQQDHLCAPLPLQTFSSPRWHLVTDGFSGLGRLSVQWLARYGARRIAVVAAHCDADWPQWQRSMAEQYGCQLRYLQCDVADPGQLNGLLAGLLAEGGIMGAIHAAGVLDDTPLTQLDEAHLAALMAAKGNAARMLRDGLRQQHSRYLLLYSSTVAALGAAGQAAQGFASGYLDGLALEQFGAVGNEHDLLVTSIAWGAWESDITQAQAPGDGTQQMMLDGRHHQCGVARLSIAQGLWHLEQAIMRGASYRLASWLAISKE